VACGAGAGARPRHAAARYGEHYVGLLAYLLRRLAERRDGERPLLDDTVVLFGSGIGDGHDHVLTDLPVLVVGGGACGLRHGRHLVCPPQTPMANLHLGFLRRFGGEDASFADSTAALDLG
jgi:hypothetical protein